MISDNVILAIVAIPLMLWLVYLTGRAFRKQDPREETPPPPDYAAMREPEIYFWSAGMPKLPDRATREEWDKLLPCNCLRCSEAREPTIGARRMFLCALCGNKRCPHSDWHGYPCTGSNDPGQPGSRYRITGNEKGAAGNGGENVTTTASQEAPARERCPPSPLLRSGRK